MGTLGRKSVSPTLFVPIGEVCSDFILKSSKQWVIFFFFSCIERDVYISSIFG